MKIENVAVIPLEEYEEYAKWKQLKDKPVIDYDSLRTGSVVKIRYNGNHCCGISRFNLSEPVRILLYKTNSFLHEGILRTSDREFITFIQEDKICHFTADNINYIIEVISY